MPHVPNYHQTLVTYHTCPFCVCWAGTTIKMNKYFLWLCKGESSYLRSCESKNHKISVKLKLTSSPFPTPLLILMVCFPPKIPVIPKQLHFQEKKCNKQSKFIKQGSECISATFGLMSNSGRCTLSLREIICNLYYDDTDKCHKMPFHDCRYLLNSLKIDKNIVLGINICREYAQHIPFKFMTMALAGFRLQMGWSISVPMEVAILTAASPSLLLRFYLNLNGFMCFCWHWTFLNI